MKIITTLALLALITPAHAVDFDQSIDIRAALNEARQTSIEGSAASIQGAPIASPQVNPLTAPGGVDALKHLLSLKQEQLDKLFSLQLAGPIPAGDSQGRAAFFPGTWFGNLTQRVTALFWQGKYFDLKQGIVINKIIGLKAIKAKIYYGKSQLDSRKAIILDYSATSPLAGMVRDEMRQVAPHIYLGRAYLNTPVGTFHLLNFALDFRP